MSDDPPFFARNQPRAPRQPKPGEKLFEFIRASDGVQMSCELRFHGESYGWEVQFLERGEWFYSRGAFVFREAAVRWAEQERDDFQRGPAV